jgi:hypothetical protein
MSISQPPSRLVLQRRLRALLIVGLLLAPTFCGFPFLAFIAHGWLRWLILVLWVVVGALLGLLVARALRTLEALSRDRSDR